MSSQYNKGRKNTYGLERRILILSVYIVLLTQGWRTQSQYTSTKCIFIYYQLTVRNENFKTVPLIISPKKHEIFRDKSNKLSPGSFCDNYKTFMK